MTGETIDLNEDQKSQHENMFAMLHPGILGSTIDEN